MDGKRCSVSQGLGLNHDLILWSLFAKTEAKPIPSSLMKGRKEKSYSAKNARKSFFTDQSQESSQNTSVKSLEKARGSSSSDISHLSLVESCAYQSFPPEVQLCLSSIPGNKFGVMATTTIPKGMWIGPYEGKLVDSNKINKLEDPKNMWEIIYQNRLCFFIDGTDLNTSSWMRFIQCARNKMEQNASAFQYQGRMYYRLLRDIAAREEILVWYDDSYPQYMGIPVMDQYFLNNYKEPTSILERNAIGKFGSVSQEEQVKPSKRTCSSQEDNQFEPISKILRTDDASSNNTVQKQSIDKARLPLETTTSTLSQTSPLSLDSDSSRHDNWPDYHGNSHDRHDNSSNHHSNLPSHPESPPGRRDNSPNIHSNSPNHHSNSTSHPGSPQGRHDNSSIQHSRSPSDHSNSRGRRGNSLSDHDNSCSHNGSSPDRNNSSSPDHSNNNNSPGRDDSSELKPSECAQCGKKFPQRVMLQIHLCPKQTNAPYQCGHCPLSFTNPSDLRGHVMTHIGEKPFKCGFCARTFAGATTLNNHIRVHTGQPLSRSAICKTTDLASSQKVSQN